MFEPKLGGDAKILNLGNDALATAVIVGMIIVVFVLDLMIPLGYAVWLLYFVPLLIATSAPRVNPIVLTTVVTILIVIGFFLSSAGVSSVPTFSH